MDARREEYIQVLGNGRRVELARYGGLGCGWGAVTYGDGVRNDKDAQLKGLIQLWNPDIAGWEEPETLPLKPGCWVVLNVVVM